MFSIQNSIQPLDSSPKFRLGKESLLVQAWCPWHCRLLAALTHVATESVVRSLGDSGAQAPVWSTCGRDASPDLPVDHLLLGHSVVKCVQFAQE